MTNQSSDIAKFQTRAEIQGLNPLKLI